VEDVRRGAFPARRRIGNPFAPAFGHRNLCAGIIGAVAAVATLAGCSGWLARSSEEFDPTTLPENVRGDYAVFAERCSKCHSLARPLTSGIDDDEYWAMYVARMRRQPSSGISLEDTVVVLRFLHYFSEDLKAKKAKREALSPPSPSALAPAPIPSQADPGAARPSPSSTAGELWKVGDVMRCPSGNARFLEETWKPAL
jgi:hypothetical protein